MKAQFEKEQSESGEFQRQEDAPEAVKKGLGEAEARQLAKSLEASGLKTKVEKE